LANSLPYIIGHTPDGLRPLSRFLPALPEGVISTWLTENVPTGAWVIDPFGASPRLAIEAARAGYRVLVSANNPVARFLLEISASRPSQSELRAALAELASAHHGEGRIEPYIRSLYNTTCAACGQIIMADAFLWERGATAPYARIYHCPFCGDEGEHPVNDNDLRLASQFTVSGPHRARALERVASPSDPDRVHVEEALSIYLPRAVYVLFTLINKLDGMTISETRRRHIQSLLIHAADMGNSLWAMPNPRPRPRQLATPPRFRENNIWLALEQGILACGDESPAKPVPAVSWPEDPPEQGGLCIFEGRLKELSAYLEKHDIQAVIAALPRHNQAFWTLSALWAGWLWGREAVGPFKVVLRRRWYDWAWHTTALYLALQHLSPNLPDSTPFFGMLSEVEAGFLTASLTAADAAGFFLESLAIHEDTASAQILWKQNKKIDEAGTVPTIENTVLKAIRAYLSERAEPASYILSIAAGLQGIAEIRLHWKAMNPGGYPVEMDGSGESEQVDGTNEQQIPARPHYLYSTTNSTLRRVLTNQSEFVRYQPNDKDGLPETGDKAHSTELEIGQYWLYETNQINLSLADRVEMAVVRNLTKYPNCSFSTIQKSIFESFPGLLTPDNELIQTCLESYGELVEEDRWKLRDQDQPAQRRSDLDEIFGIIKSISQRLNLQVEERKIATQQNRVGLGLFDPTGQPLYWFYPIVSAVISDILLQQPLNGKNIIVLPGSRANLVVYKLNRDARLAERCQPPSGWQFLKFRYLRWQLENPLLNLESLAQSLELDPLTYSSTQLRLL
jgi:hypothetical protein